MSRIRVFLFLFPLMMAVPALSGQPTGGFPFSNEDLTYAIVWPSGISLGEAKLSASRTMSDWKFSLSLDASVPGYAVKDQYRSVAGLNLCSASFERTTLHGAKKAQETTSFTNGVAIRQTVGGGQSEIPVPACAHDALTFLFYARQLMGQGKVPPSETIVFGGGYRLELQYTGLQTITTGNAPSQADRVFCTVKIKENQKYEFEIFFARDAARTPLLIRAPFALGAISMELVR